MCRVVLNIDKKFYILKVSDQILACLAQSGHTGARQYVGAAECVGTCVRAFCVDAVEYVCIAFKTSLEHAHSYMCMHMKSM